MKTKLRKAFALLLVLSMLTSLLSVGASAAASEDPGTNPDTEQGGGDPGGPGGGPGGESSKSVDLTGMLSLKQYVFVASEGEVKNGSVSTTIHGIYEKGEEVAFEPAAFQGEIAVYADSGLTEEAGVTAAVSGSTLTLSGVATEGNVAYYLTTGEDAYTTTVFVVNDEYSGETATLTLADGTTIDLSTYAPNMANGDYTAVVGENEIEGDTSVYIGANRTAVSLDDLTDTENYAGYEDAVAWYLRSGITNAGDSLTTFGDKLYGYEYAVGLYRLFQIVVDQVTSDVAYTDPIDFVGAMGSNDPYSDSVSATLQAGVWNGIYTKLTDTKSEGDSGFWLTTNISEDVTTLGTGAVVDAEFAYVGAYNAFQSPWSSLNEAGEAAAEALEEAAAVATAGAFKDANTTSSWRWAAPYIGKSAAAGLFSGDEKGNFDAEKNLSRAELAQVLYAMAGKPAVESTTNCFTDLTQDWYKDAVEWCFVNGITAGRTATTFVPDASVTREEMALMLMKFCEVQKIELTGTNDLSAFPDKTQVSNWAATAMQWAVGNGLISGSDGKLLPQAPTTRAMAATIMSHLADFAPYDYSNAAKISAVSSVLMGEAEAPVADKALTKAQAVGVLYACRDYVASKTAPDATLAEKTGSAWADMSQFFTSEYGASPIVVKDGQTQNLTAKDNLISEESSALMVLAGGTANVTNSTISLTGNADKAVDKILSLTDSNRTLDGAEAATDPTHDGFVFNATTRNAFYRVGIGSALTIWGGNVNLTSTDGTLAIDGEASGSTQQAGTMAGTAYVSYGGSLLVKNAVAYSSSQHLTNNLYNGTIHYIDSAAIGSGRVFSSDFWGGYQVFEDSIANGGNVTDEPTTLIVKNSVFGNSVGGNGYASQYFENSILNVSTANFQNTTSLVTDTGSLTVVNSVLNNSSSTLAASNKGERAIITIVDSTVNLNGNVLATVANHESVNNISTQTVTTDIEEYKALYDGEMAIRFYGDVELNVPSSDKLSVNVAEGAKLTVYSANLTKDDIVNTGAGELVVVTDAAYGTVNVNPPTPEEETSENIKVDNIAGMLSLDKYVVENDGETSVSVTCYGQFENGEDSVVAPFSGELTVYLDKALTTQAAGVTASVADGKLTVTGVDTEDNVVYYLSTGEGYYTVLYVVNNQVATSYTQELSDGQTLELTDYAPKNGTSDVYIGGNQGLMSVDDFTDLDNATDAEKAVAEWWLAAGITNGGATLNKFGDTFHTFELSVYLYRNFQIVVDDNTAGPDFVDTPDYSGSMGSNDQFSDAISATMLAGIWDGLYTQWVDGKLANIEGVTELGCTNAVDETTLMVSLYNAFNCRYATLTEKGESVKAAINAAAGENPTNAQKIAAVESALGVTFGGSSTQKLNVLTVLKEIAGCTAPVADSSKTVAVDEDGNTIYAPETMEGLMSQQTAVTVSENTTFENTDELLSTEITSLFVKDGTVNLINAPVTASGSNAVANEVVGAMDFGPSGPYFASGYNLTAGNAFYRMGIGALLAAHGYDTVVNLTSTNGEPVLFGSNGTASMAGGLFNGFGATINVNNGVVYSSGQHPSNTVYNGTIHYNESGVFGSVRQFSSDFWGGYIVFEDSESVGVAIVDEPTTVIYKNSYTDMASLGADSGSINLHGYASMYLENSVVDNGYMQMMNNTSVLTDVTSLTMVNTIWNGRSIGEVSRSGNNVTTLVDSTLNLTTDSILTATNNITSYAIANGTATDELTEMYLSEAAIYVYGDVYVNTASNNAGFTVDEDAAITLYVNEIVGDLDTSNITVVYGDEYGTLIVNRGQIAPEAGNVGQYAGVVIDQGSRDTSKEYTEGISVKGSVTDNFYSGNIDTDSYYATGILVNDSNYRIFKSNINMGTNPADNDAIPEGGTPEIGAGSGIAVRNGSTVTISDSIITTSGAWANMDYPRAGVVVGWQSEDNGDVVIMRNTSISNNGDDENTSNVGYFPAIPGFPLNIMKNLTVSGQGRAYVALGDAVSYLYNDNIEGTGWAAICTDMATAKGLYVYALGTVGLTTVGGYGVYSDTNCYDYFYASTLQGADFGAILSNNGLLVMDSALNASEEALEYATKDDLATAITKDSAIIGGRNAIMSHATDAQEAAEDAGIIDLANTKIATDLSAKGTTEEQSYLDGFEKFFELCDGADILIKSSSEDVDLVNVKATSYTNTLIQAVVDSDNGGAVGSLLPNEVYLENVTTSDEAMNIYNYDFQRGMNVEIAKMDLVGAINYMTYEEYAADPYLEGIIELQSTDDSNAGISLTIDAGASWTPTQISRLTSLTVNGTVNGVVLVDGEVVAVETGKTYEGNIVVSPETVKIAGVTYTDAYVETHASDDDTINSSSASSNIASVTLSEGTVINAKDGGVLTLVVNGDQYDILDYLEDGTELKAGEYSFETTAGSVPYSEMAKFMNMAGQTAQYTFRAALTVNADGIVENETIPSLLTKADYSAAGISNGELNSYGAFFNSIIVDSADFIVSNMKLTGIGDGANDFNGSGAVVFAKGDADVTVDSSVITTAGVIRTGTAVSDNAIMRISNSVVYTQETEDTQAEYDALVVPMMKRTPFALGLEGVVRATNVLGAGQGIYTDSLIVSTGWGVLSTDSGRGYDQVGTYALDVSNTVAGTGTVEVAQEGKDYFATKEVDGVTYGYTAGGSGYVAYADAGVWDKFDNVKFYGGNEVQIMASSTSSAFYTNSELNSGHIGVMTQQNNGGLISIVDSTLNVGETGVQIKSGAANKGWTNVVLDNTQVNFTSGGNWGGTLVELVESDDAGNPGNTSYTINDTGDTATSADAQGLITESTALLANGEYTGNIWNNIYNYYQALNVTVDNATVNGTISSSYGYHVNDDGTRMANGTVLYADTTGNYLKSGVTDYAKIGAQYNVANTQVNNPLNVELVNGSTWNVVLADGTNGKAEACHINDLTVEAGSTITAAAPVTIYVHGTLNVEGAVGENITIVEEPIEAPAFSNSSFSIADYNDPANVITFYVVDEDGNPVSGAVDEEHQSFAYIRLTLTALSGYEIKSVEYDDSVIVDDGTNEIDYNGYDTVITLTQPTAAATITVAAQESGGMPGGEGPAPDGEMPPM